MRDFYIDLTTHARIEAIHNHEIGRKIHEGMILALRLKLNGALEEGDYPLRSDVFQDPDDPKRLVVRFNDSDGNQVYLKPKSYQPNFEVRIDFTEAAQEAAEKETAHFTAMIAKQLLEQCKAQNIDPTEVVIRVQHEITRSLLELANGEDLQTLIAAEILERLPEIMVNAARESGLMRPG